MSEFGKDKKIEELVDAIGCTFSGQTMIMPISPDELISLSKYDMLIAGYIMGFQIHIISQSPFKEKDHKGILMDSYYNLFGSADAQEAIYFAFNNCGDEVFKHGITLGIQDIIDFGNNSKNPPLGLVRILHERISR